MFKELIQTTATCLAVLLMALFTPLAAAQSSAESAASAAAAATQAGQAAQAASRLAAAAASSASAAGAVSWSAPSSFALYGVPVVVLIGSLMAILSVQRALKPGAWSLADALSEEVNLPVWKETTDAAGVKVREPVLDKDQKPVLAPEMRASSSRVIALMGGVVLIFMYVGFGVFALYGFGRNGRLPDEISGVVTFLVAGMTLFAPYLVNRFASVFQGLTGGK